MARIYLDEYLSSTSKLLMKGIKMHIYNSALEPRFRGKINHNKKVVLAASAMVSADTLFAASKKDGIKPQEINAEYYQNEFQMRNKQCNLRFPATFTNEEKMEFLYHADDIKLFPKAFYKIISAKNEDNTTRFNGEDSLKLFEYTAQEIENYPEIFQSILSVKDEEGKNFLYDADDCVELMSNAELFSNNKKLFEHVIALKAEPRDIVAAVSSLGYIVKEYPELWLQNLDDALNESTSDDKLRNVVNRIEKMYADRKKKFANSEIVEKVIDNEVLLEKSVRYKRYFHKVINSRDNKIPLVLSNGEMLPDKKRNAIAENIILSNDKAIDIIKLSYDDGTPVFDEAECFDILSELPKYRYAENRSAITILDSKGKPFFTPQQCKEILSFRYSSKINNDINQMVVYKHLTADKVLDELRERQAKFEQAQLLKQQIKQLKEQKEKEKALAKYNKRLELNNRIKEIGWISADQILEKLKFSTSNNKPYIMENGEILQGNNQAALLRNYRDSVTKILSIINLRYANKLPIFSEKQILEILKDIKMYNNANGMTALKIVDNKDKPFFSPEQCKALLQIDLPGLNSRIIALKSDTKRKYTSEQIVQILQNIASEKQLAQSEETKILQEQSEIREQFVNKIFESKQRNKSMELSTGEVIPDEMRDEIINQVLISPNKAKQILNARYNNNQFIFSEKECCEILRELDSYYYLNSLGSLKTIKDDGSPFFTPQQCKELLKLKMSTRDSQIYSYLSYSVYKLRELSSDDIVKILKNSDLTYSVHLPFYKYFRELDKNGNCKYTISECIEMAKKDKFNL